MNTTVRDGQRPARLRSKPPQAPQALAVFTPWRKPLTNAKGEVVLGANQQPVMRVGFAPNAASGELLSDTHYFDGRSIRRVGKLHGKTAKRLRRARRLEAARLQASAE